MSYEAETSRKSGLSVLAPLFVMWTVTWMVTGARLVPETRGPSGPLVGAAMGFAVAMYPLLLFKLTKMGHGAFAVRIVVLGSSWALLAAAIWLAFPSTRLLWVPLW